MLIKEVAKLTPMERFLYWIQERESIRLKREAGLPKPWTDDEILQRYRFCNVRRMDDRVSQWLLKNWYEPNFDHPNMLIACILARFFNLPSSLEAIGFPFVADKKYLAHACSTLLEMWNNGANVFNSAYIVLGRSGITKVECVLCEYVLPVIRAQCAIDTVSMKNSWIQLKQFRGMGSFTAGQVVADLRWAAKGEWKDKRRWAAIGPGSQRGMNRLLGHSEKAVNIMITQNCFEPLLMSVKRNAKISKSISRRMEAIDWQNCLCEFDKYSRTLTEGRRPKSLFRSEK